MRVSTHLEAVLISIMFIALTIGSIMVFKAAAPGYYAEITGEVARRTTVNITPAPPVPCDYTLYSGLNLISLHCIGEFESPEFAFGNQSGLVGVITYRKGASDPWKAYGPNLPSWVVNDLTFVSKKEGYWVRMNSTQNYFLSGPQPSATDIPLTPGYNLVGYPKNESEAIATSLVSINGNYSKVVGFDPVTKTFVTYIPGSGGSLNETEPFRGYWLNMTTTDTWVVN